MTSLLICFAANLPSPKRAVGSITETNFTPRSFYGSQTEAQFHLLLRCGSRRCIRRFDAQVDCNLHHLPRRSGGSASAQWIAATKQTRNTPTLTACHQSHRSRISVRERWVLFLAIGDYAIDSFCRLKEIDCQREEKNRRYFARHNAGKSTERQSKSHLRLQHTQPGGNSIKPIPTTVVEQIQRLQRLNRVATNSNSHSTKPEIFRFPDSLNLLVLPNFNLI